MELRAILRILPQFVVVAIVIVILYAWVRLPEQPSGQLTSNIG
ncbi:hypothetical protein [Alteraurantiacibacter aquimixticola]|nr:hypothetical protein [Alteraurantiacibacter aquimixticola]